MSYNFKRALGIGFLLYLGTFVVGIVCGIISGADMTSFNDLPDYYWYVGMVAAVVLTALFAKWYFRNPAIMPSAKSGFYFGLTAVVLSFVLDVALFSLGNMNLPEAEKVDIWEYYSDYRFWIIVVLVIATAKLVGHMNKSRS